MEKQQMYEAAMIRLWRRDLEAIALRLGMKKTPTLCVTRSPLDRVMKTLSLGKNVGAWGGLGRVCVAKGWLSLPDEQRKVVIAHEVGHIYCKHAWKFFVPSFFASVCLGLVLNMRLRGAPYSPLLGAASWIGLLSLLWLGVTWCFGVTHKFEIEADAVAVAARLFGNETVYSVVRALAIYEGNPDKPSSQRTARLKALAKRINNPAKRV
jgi:Zn-dependent protease with chaperone function